ncbi:MAG: ABC transporter ATP-binding protein [Alphaproteobacteria bacterium]|nr:ABC transporter ATP-binding protein [Alphaproteobacteria bacterium]
MTAALAATGLSAGYGAAVVVRDVTLAVAPGTLVALVGSNGAGKSTLLGALAGLVAARGAVTLGGRPLDALAPYERVEQGVVLVPEGRQVFAGLTVEENLRIAAFAPRVRGHAARNLARVFERFPRLDERRDQAAGTLSGGEQQMLAIGRALMAEPSVLLLDEPTLSLAPITARAVFDIVADLRAQGLTILMAEQDVHRTLAMADHAYLMASGTIVDEGAGRALLDRADIKRAYLGL